MERDSPCPTGHLSNIMWLREQNLYPATFNILDETLVPVTVWFIDTRRSLTEWSSWIRYHISAVTCQEASGECSGRHKKKWEKGKSVLNIRLLKRSERFWFCSVRKIPRNKTSSYLYGRDALEGGVAADSRPFNRPFCSVMQQNVNMERTRNSLLEQGRREGGRNCLLGDSFCQVVSILCFKHVRVIS